MLCEVVYFGQSRKVNRSVMSDQQLYQFEIRSVPGLLGAYVSDCGKVFSRDRKQPAILNTRKPYLGKVGYYVVTFKGEHSRQAPRYVHRMVAESFLPPRDDNHEVRHLDGDRLNNRVANLTWGTRLENVADTRRHGRMIMGEKSHLAKLTEQKVRMIRCLLAGGFSAYSIAPLFGVETHAIAAIKSGKSWGHIDSDPNALDAVRLGG